MIKLNFGKILVSNGISRGIRLQDGRTVGAEVIISNADLRFTVEHLLRSDSIVSELSARIQTTPVSEIFFSAYLGTTIPICELRESLRDAHHTWVFPLIMGFQTYSTYHFIRLSPWKSRRLFCTMPISHSTDLVSFYRYSANYDWMDRNLFCAGHWVLYPGGLLRQHLPVRLLAILHLRHCKVEWSQRTLFMRRLSSAGGNPERRFYTNAR